MSFNCCQVRTHTIIVKYVHTIVVKYAHRERKTVGDLGLAAGKWNSLATFGNRWKVKNKSSRNVNLKVQPHD